MTGRGDGDLQVGFRDVDATGDSARFVEYLDAVTAMLREHKLALVEALQLSEGDSAIDVGCGVGDDVVLLAERVGSGGHAIGVDSSANLLAEARSRTAEIASATFIRADAHVLPVGDGSFDGAHVERTLQHVADPAMVVREMARVTRPGCRVVAFDADWHTLVFSGADIATSRRLAADVVAHCRHPAAGTQLPSWFAAAGLLIEDVGAVAVPTRSIAMAERIFNLGAAIRRLRDAAVSQWSAAAQEDSRAGTFLTAATGLGPWGGSGALLPDRDLSVHPDSLGLPHLPNAWESQSAGREGWH
jgi:ubiquinone/menaquinone biosynthesis C-methylase UbiE